MDAEDILQNMLLGLKGELEDGFELVSSFAERQGRLLAKQAALLARERAAGFLSDDDELFDFFMLGMQRDSENLARSIAMMTILTIEKAWNAVAKALWGGISTILTAAGVPAGLIPAMPQAPQM